MLKLYLQTKVRRSNICKQRMSFKSKKAEHKYGINKIKHETNCLFSGFTMIPNLIMNRLNVSEHEIVSR